MTERRNRETDWVCLGTDLESYDKKVFINKMGSRNEKKDFLWKQSFDLGLIQNRIQKN